MITVDEALAIVLDRAQPLGSETIALEVACGRVLAQDVVADMDLPPFNRARMDGYALRSEDVQVVPASLVVIGEIAAGTFPTVTLQSGEAMKIFTGAPVPLGADAVQKVEVTESNGRKVIIKEAVKSGQFITPHASEVVAGEAIAPRGRQINAAEMAVLASFGYAQIRVGKQPRVAVFSTGSELVTVSSLPSAGQIRNSNSYTVAAYAEKVGAQVEVLGIVKDDIQTTRDALLAACEDHDVVITSGGVSMGDYDLVKAALNELGAEVFFDKVMIRPGKPTVFARLRETYIFALPGNPVSASVTFNVFVRPALRQMQGDASPLLPSVRARTSRAINDASNRRSYLPAWLSLSDGEALVESLKWGGSSDLVAFMNANSLIVVPEPVHAIAERELVTVIRLDQSIAER